VIFTLEEAMKTQSGRNSFSFNIGARWGWVVNATPRPLYPRERPGTHCTRSWVGPGPVWTGAKNLAFTGTFFFL